MQDRGVGQKLADPGGSEVQVIILHEEQGSLGPARGGHGSLGKPLVRGAIALSPGGNHGRVDVGREGQGVHLVLEEPQQRVGNDSVVAVKHVLRQDLVAEAHVVVRKGALDQRSNEREGGRVIRGTVAARPRRIAQLLQEPGHGLVALGQSRGGPRDRCVAPQLHERRDQTSRAAAGRETRGHIRIELEGDWPAVRDDVEPAVLAEQVGQKRGTIRGHPQSVLPGPSHVVLPGLRRHNSPASQRPPDVSRAYR